MISRTSRPLLIGLLAAAFALEAAPPTRVAGRAKVTDGDSLEIDGTRIRLFAVDAPEARQSCTLEGKNWACGRAATEHLRRLVGTRSVDCQQKDEDDYGRMVAICRTGTTDLGAAMVSAGLALAYRHYGTDYVFQEGSARTARRGLWAGDFTPPWDWRLDERRSKQAAAKARTTEAARGQSDRCRIKGNINGRGERIYHTPASPAYAGTEIDEGRGERWFCSEREAQRAGWRAPR